MTDCGTVTVETAGGSVSVSSRDVSPSTADPGESVTATATVQNNSSSQVSAQVEIVANGTVIFSNSVTVPAGGTSDVSASFTPSGVGAGGGETFNVTSSVSSASFSAVASRAVRKCARTDGGGRRLRERLRARGSLRGSSGCGCGGSCSCGH